MLTIGTILILIVLGFWLYNGYQEGGWSWIFAEWWKGAGIALVGWIVLVLFDQVRKK